jgi:group I intron endonuclease
MKFLEERLKLTTVPGIYKITNTVTKKIYIGSSVNLRKRCNQHRSDLKGNRHSNGFLQSAVNKYGAEVFTIEVVEYVVGNDLLEREQYYMELYRACDEKYGYNLQKLAKSIRVHTQRTKDKMSAASKGRPKSEAAKAAMQKAHLGEKHSQERRDKKRQTMASMTPEQRVARAKKISDSMKKYRAEQRAQREING